MFVFELIERPAPLLGDIRREFHAIQAEVRSAEQTHLLAHQQDVAEDILDLALH